ncbi:NPAS4 protein, partial [Nothocercus nigrocapillus]|nr:NPAS4 protein [Nothocercus nigrocapillus]
MTIFCSHCHRPLPAESGCLPRGAGQVPSASKPFRSTKGASKARRDQINVELQALRSLLPMSCREKERLSYLNTMALVCLRLRAARLFPPGEQRRGLQLHAPAPVQPSAYSCALPADSAPPAGPALGTDLLSLLPGFFLVLLANGKLAYVSENVSEVLGLSTAELLSQGDTVFDMVEGTAREVVREKLLLAQEQPGAEVTFVSEMRTSKAFRLRHGGNRAVAVRGRFVVPRVVPACPTAPSAFMALCTPVARLPADRDAASPDDLFHSMHGLDMAFTDVTESVVYHLGYRREELIGRSWYSLLHPEDTQLAASQHRAVALGTGAALSGAAVLRLLRSDRTWLWLHVALRRDCGSSSITCTSRSLR